MAWHDQRMYRELLAEEIEAEHADNEADTTRFNAAGDLSASGFTVTRVPPPGQR